MERFVSFLHLAVALAVFVLPVYGQINTACTASVLGTFTPCMNFLTNSTANGASPTADCCGSLKNLTSNGMDCLCLIVTGSVPFRIPINRTLAISLPRACNMPGVPVQCKATGAPVPSPGPVSLGPTPSPGVSPSASPKASVVPEPTPSTLPPASDTTPLLNPPSSTGDSGAPPSSTGSRPVLTPSASVPSHGLSPSLLLFALGFVLFKNEKVGRAEWNDAHSLQLANYSCSNSVISFIDTKDPVYLFSAMNSQKLVLFRFIWGLAFVLGILIPAVKCQIQGCSIQDIDLGLSSSPPPLSTPLILPLSNCFVSVPPLSLCGVPAPMPIQFPPTIPDDITQHSTPPKDVLVSPPLSQTQVQLNSTREDNSTAVATQPFSSTELNLPKENETSNGRGKTNRILLKLLLLCLALYGYRSLA
ncbi:unnamed protein product [Dovyalis caffra]|uniref:Bifunctional inhibitor/plant lipid transfer protein/seed storage helical domain-containing protein n=1 Tax=Dovyalis caffra TaxID=77055 RepID=A0AAV1R3S0_9ROSI|nr:unnamed protein product [Dovyalis caffra]